MKKKYSLVIHGGAGQWDLIPKEKSEKLKKICMEGEIILKNNGSALEAVKKVITLMEDDPLFNAGKGSALSLEGELEMDSSIMLYDFENKKNLAGAVCGIKNFKNPILIASKVMLESEYVFLSGEGAEKFASLFFKKINNSELITKKRIDERKKILKKIKENQKIKYEQIKKLVLKNPNYFFGTVGAVAFDGKTLVAGTSTGGHPYKSFGRVGDSAIIGSGTIANEFCGISVTGFGEYSIITSLSNSISIHYELNQNFKEAMKFGFKKIENLFGNNNTAIIGINKNGEIQTFQNTTKFGFAYCNENKKSTFVMKELNS